jgi:hypothetical protein
LKQQGLPGILASAELHRLSEHFNGAGFFDIETATEGGITLIACLQGERIHTFVRGENLDGFLDLVDRVPLLVSFNGLRFDVPQVLEHFHIPSLPCAHLDLRYPCKACGLTGGLKAIEKALGIRRPDDVLGLDGEDAMWLWRAWERDRDENARRRVIRYCRADVVGLREIASHLLDQHLRVFSEPPRGLWHLLDEPIESMAPAPAAPPLDLASGDALYRRLRAKVRQRKLFEPRKSSAVDDRK